MPSALTSAFAISADAHISLMTKAAILLSSTNGTVNNAMKSGSLVPNGIPRMPMSSVGTSTSTLRVSASNVSKS